jgi:ABC-type polysaccharide/polyol phosphate export permease
MLRVFRTFRTHHELFWNLVLKDLRSRYRRSALGWAWSFMNPAALTIVYTIVFTRFLIITPEPGKPSGITSFAVFLLAGLLPWNLLAGGIGAGIGGLMGAAGIIQKVNFPRELVVMAPVAALSISLCIELLVLSGAVILTGNVMLYLIPYVLLGICLLTLFVAGITMFLSALNVRYRDIQHLTNVLLLMWMYLTPLLYSPKLVPEKTQIFGATVPARQLLLLNPMARFVQFFRNCFYDITPPPLDTTGALAAASVVVFFLGYRFFIRRALRFPEEM